VDVAAFWFMRSTLRAACATVIRMCLRHLLALCSLLAASSAAANPQPLVLAGDDSHPPYSWQENGQPKGLYVELLQLALQQLPGQTVRWEMEPWRRALRRAELGQAHALFPPHRFGAERPFLGRYVPLIGDEQPVVVCQLERLQARTRTRWPEDFGDLRFGLSAGVLMGGDAFWAAVNRGDIRAEAVGSIQLNLRKLMARRSDCHINTRYSINWALNQGPVTPGAPTLVVAVRLPPSGGHLAFVRSPAAPLQAEPELERQLSEALDALRRDGTVNRLLVQRGLVPGPPDWAGVIHQR
jgi:polar amino acid transport system substrate-binding protein